LLCKGVDFILNIETKELKISDKLKSNKLELGVITINLSNIRSTDGTQLYKNIFKTSKVPT